MTRWMRPPEIDRQHKAARFDAVIEGARCGLSREVSLSIWRLVGGEANDSGPRPNEEEVQRRFRELALRTAARGGRLSPDVGKLTRVEEIDRGSSSAWSANDRRPSTAGRQTLVMATERAQPTFSSVPGRRTLALEESVSPHFGFDDYRVVGLKALLQHLGPNHVLQPDLLAAATSVDRGVAWRAKPWLTSLPAVPAPTPNGHALWNAAERHATTLYRRAESSGLVNAQDPAVESTLQQRGAGHALPEEVRVAMERELGVELAGVRIHTDGVAAQAARVLGAEAFTIGEDVFFAAGLFAPDTRSGRALLAHELTHVAQALRGRAAPKGEGLRVSRPDEPLEREADAVAARVDARPARGWRTSLWPDSTQLDRSRRHAGPEREAGRSGASARSAVQSISTLFRAPVPGASLGPLGVPAGGVQVNEIGIVAWDGQPALRLHASPGSSDNDVIGSLPFNTRVQVIQRFSGDWLLVAMLDGKMGFCARQHVWYPPEHKMPEPNARLHKVVAGDEGHAIHIARHYYGTMADKWGSDLRFFVNVLGAVNHLQVPDSTEGWKTVRFKAGDYIWIPGVDFARALQGTLNSGSPSYQTASALGVEGVSERVGELLGDFKEAIRLSGKYIPAAVARHVEQSVASILESLLWMAVGAAALLAITTALGAAIGALGGGVGAAPGAAAGFEVGMALLDWIGLGFLVGWISNAVVRIGTSFGAFFGAVWNARGDKNALDRAALSFAEAIGTLAGVLIEALVMWAVSVGIKTATAKLKGTTFARQLGEGRLGEWLEQRIKNYKAGDSPLPAPRAALRRLLEMRRRGEGGGETTSKPTIPPDVWSDLASRHNLDDVVTQILREENIEPATADRLLVNGMNQFDLGELALDSGGKASKTTDASGTAADGEAARGASAGQGIATAAKDTGELGSDAGSLSADQHPHEQPPAPRGGPGAAHIHDESFSANRTFEPSEKHSGKDRTVGGRKVAKEPADGAAALDFSFQVSNNSPRRIGIDVKNNEFVVFDRTGNKVVNKEVAGGVFHGHVRFWDELEAPMKKLLVDRGLVKNGKITVDSDRWTVP